MTEIISQHTVGIVYFVRGEGSGHNITMMKCVSYTSSHFSQVVLKLSHTQMFYSAPLCCLVELCYLLWVRNIVNVRNILLQIYGSDFYTFAKVPEAVELRTWAPQ
jgi:hypothetical protein